MLLICPLSIVKSDNARQGSRYKLLIPARPVAHAELMLMIILVLWYVWEDLRDRRSQRTAISSRQRNGERLSDIVVTGD